MDALTCAVDDCRTTIGLTPFSIQPQTLRALGYVAGDDALVVRVCTFHYLLAMGQILQKLGLPRAEPTVVPPTDLRRADAPPTGAQR